MIKVDLTKAYDNLSWHYVQRVMVEAGFPPKLIQLVMDAISSLLMRIRWNGKESNYFKAAKGLQQGDPISPYLFVLCMKKLFHLISGAADSG